MNHGCHCIKTHHSRVFPKNNGVYSAIERTEHPRQRQLRPTRKRISPLKTSYHRRNRAAQLSSKQCNFSGFITFNFDSLVRAWSCVRSRTFKESRGYCWSGVSWSRISFYKCFYRNITPIDCERSLLNLYIFYPLESSEQHIRMFGIFF